MVSIHRNELILQHNTQCYIYNEGDFQYVKFQPYKFLIQNMEIKNEKKDGCV